MFPGRRVAVAQGAFAQARKQRNVSKAFPPSRVHGIDFDHPRHGTLARLALRTLVEDHELNLAFANRLLGTKAKPGMHRGDREIVDAFGIGNLERNRRSGSFIAGLIIRRRNGLSARTADDLRLKSQGRSARVEQGGLKLKLEYFTWRKDEVFAIEADPQPVARRARYQQVVSHLVERAVVRLTDQAAEWDFHGLGHIALLVAQRDDKSSLGVRGNQHVHAIVGAQRALADSDLVIIEPNRAGLISFDAQRL